LAAFRPVPPTPAHHARRAASAARRPAHLDDISRPAHDPSLPDPVSPPALPRKMRVRHFSDTPRTHAYVGAREPRRCGVVRPRGVCPDARRAERAHLAPPARAHGSLCRHTLSSPLLGSERPAQASSSPGRFLSGVECDNADEAASSDSCLLQQTPSRSQTKHPSGPSGCYRCAVAATRRKQERA